MECGAAAHEICFGDSFTSPSPSPSPITSNVNVNVNDHVTSTIT
jgi:hypothetical protein